MKKSTAYWFPARSHGWGWGPPVAWQGWVVLAVFALSIALAAVHFLPLGMTNAFVGCAFLLSVVLCGICYAKGEPPAWRWGGK